MTRSFNEKIRCTQCGCEHTAETDFERWFRNNKNLDSKTAGIVRYDLDVLLHKYKNTSDRIGDRTIQCLMFIEVKTFFAEPSPAQSDSLFLFDQILRNRRPNINSGVRRQTQSQITKAYSQMMKKDIALKMYGGHLLQMNASCPVSSTMILWDRKIINVEILEELLRFERNPDNFNSFLDDRRRSGPRSKQINFDF